MRFADSLAQSMRRWVACAGLAWLGLAGLSRAAQAANGDVAGLSTVLATKDLSDIAFDPTAPPAGGSFWALGRLSGKIYHLSADLNTLLGEINNPHGTGQFPNVVQGWGITYRTSTRSLFVLAQVEGLWKVREVKTSDGTEDTAGAFTVSPPDPGSANLRGLAFDTLNRELWHLDIFNDKVFRTDLTGTATAVFPLPGDEPPETTLLGDGLCFEIDARTSEPRLYVAYGDIFHKNPRVLLQMDAASGQVTGVEVPLDRVTFGRLGGFQTYQFGTQRRVALVTGEGKIIQLEQVIPDPIPPSQLSCRLTLTNKVELTWQNHGSDPARAYAGEIAILRNGVPFATVRGTTTQFLDATPLQGTSMYALSAQDEPAGPFSPPGLPCEVTVGTGGIVRWIPFPFPDGSPYDVARDPAQGDIFVTDDRRGKILRYDPALNPLGEVPSPWAHPGAIAFVPSIQIQDVLLENILAVGQMDGLLLKLMEVDATEKTTISLPGNQIGGLTYLPATQEFAFLDLPSHKIVVTDRTGRNPRECNPSSSPILGLPAMDMGITYDPIQDTFLTVFQGGSPQGVPLEAAVRELFTGGTFCSPPPEGFGFSLRSLGEGFNTPGFVGGVEIAGNSLLVCGRQSKALFQVLIFPAGPPFVRGDFNRDDFLNISDAVACALYLFRAGAAPSCQDSADANDDGVLDVSDPVRVLFHLFLQGRPPPSPFPGAGSDPTFRDNLGCEE